MARYQQDAKKAVLEEGPTAAENESSLAEANNVSEATAVGQVVRVSISVFILFLNFFLAQYDKSILSYFQDDVISSLNLTSTNYGILSGYATGIVYAVLAIPIAFVADYIEARVWVLSVSALWWSLCVLFQGLSHNFWQILLARIGMGIGQAPVEAISISLISDLVGPKWLFLNERYFGNFWGRMRTLTSNQSLLRFCICWRGRQRADRYRLQQNSYAMERGPKSHWHCRNGPCRHHEGFASGTSKTIRSCPHRRKRIMYLQPFP